VQFVGDLGERVVGVLGRARAQDAGDHHPEAVGERAGLGVGDPAGKPVGRVLDDQHAARLAEHGDAVAAQRRFAVATGAEDGAGSLERGPPRRRQEGVAGGAIGQGRGAALERDVGAGPGAEHRLGGVERDADDQVDVERDARMRRQRRPGLSRHGAPAGADPWRTRRERPTASSSTAPVTTS
jgi:hypothetical protein